MAGAIGGVDEVFDHRHDFLNSEDCVSNVSTMERALANPMLEGWTLGEIGK